MQSLFMVKESCARTYRGKSIAFTILTYFNNVTYWNAPFCLTAVRNLIRITLYFITTTAMCYCTLTQLDHCTLIQHTLVIDMYYICIIWQLYRDNPLQFNTTLQMWYVALYNNSLRFVAL